MKIAVVDGQGGGMGRSLIDKIRTKLGNDIEIIALGTNSAATATMLKGGANSGATGENAIIYNVCRCDVIMGSVGIIAADAFLGELTPRVATAITQSEAVKILIPINKSYLFIAGTKDAMLADYMDDAIKLLEKVKMDIEIHRIAHGHCH